jgi:hypothetical protein
VPTPPGGSAPTPPKSGLESKPTKKKGKLENKPTDSDKELKKGQKEAEKEKKRAEKKAEKEKKRAEKKAEKEAEKRADEQPEQDDSSNQTQQDPARPQYQQPQQWPYPYPPNIQVNPQIQVQVNPDVDVKAEPKANANADANADAKAEANPEANADANIDTKIENKQTIEGHATAPGAGVLPPAPTDGGPIVEEHIFVEPGEPVDRLAGWKTPRRGPLITGVVLFGISYGASAFAGWKLENGCGNSNNFVGCKRTARNMYIPVVGPAMNFTSSDSSTTQFAVAFASGAQATGALLTVIGAVILRRDKRRNREIERAAGVRLSDNVYLGTGVGRDGGRLQLTGRF